MSLQHLVKRSNSTRGCRAVFNHLPQCLCVIIFHNAYCPLLTVHFSLSFPPPIQPRARYPLPLISVSAAFPLPHALSLQQKAERHALRHLSASAPLSRPHESAQPPQYSPHRASPCAQWYSPPRLLR